MSARIYVTQRQIDRHHAYCQKWALARCAILLKYSRDEALIRLDLFDQDNPIPPLIPLNDGWPPELLSAKLVKANDAPLAKDSAFAPQDWSFCRSLDHPGIVLGIPSNPDAISFEGLPASKYQEANELKARAERDRLNPPFVIKDQSRNPSFVRRILNRFFRPKSP